MEASVDMGVDVTERIQLRADNALARAKKLLDDADVIKADAERATSLAHDRLIEDGGIGNIAEDTSNLVELLCKGDQLLQWMRWASFIHRLADECSSILAGNAAASSSASNQSLSKGLDPKVDAAKKLARNFRQLSEATALLEKSKCANLQAFATKTKKVVVEHICCAVSGQLEEDLKALNFPQCILSKEVSVGRLATSAIIDIERFRAHFALLAMLAEGDQERQEHPVQILLRPLKTRFKFHFCGKKQTNNLVRPEWYLMQVKSWMINFVHFYEMCIAEVNARDESTVVIRFCSEMFALIAEKLKAEIPQLIDDDLLLSHVIDEILIFSKDASDQNLTAGIPVDQLPSAVLAEGEVFSRWISLERKFAFEKVDSLLLEDDMWSPSAAKPDVLKCVETFVGLLQSLTNRFRQLADHFQLQLKFVCLQCELIEDFRLRLAQILRTESDSGPAPAGKHKIGLILNSVDYLISTLEEWRDLPIFMHLHFLMEEHCDLFASEIEGFTFIIHDMSTCIAEQIFLEFKAQSFDYRRNVKWFSYTPKEPEEEEDSPSPECLAMLQALATHMHLISQTLNARILEYVVRSMAAKVGEFLVHEVVLSNFFDDEGAKQIVLDIRRGMLPIIRSYIPDLDFIELKQLYDAMILLTLELPSALLLLDTLKSNDVNVNHKKEALTEHHVSFIAPSLAARILERRSDVVANQ